MNKSIYYLDHAASAPIDPGVFEVYTDVLEKQYANPSALHSLGVDAKKTLESARTLVADVLAATQDSIVFTRGGTESINMAIYGVAYAHQSQGKHIITTAVEHSAVLSCMKDLEQKGFEITYLPVDKKGDISLKQLREAIRIDTILVSIMAVQNEIGTIYPIQEIGKQILRWRKKQDTIYPLFHSDACQATNYITLHVERMHVDILSLNGSKIYAPKSSGVLFKRRGVEITPILHGGKQEQSIRPGTEDVASAAAFAQALHVAQKIQKQETVRLSEVKKTLYASLANTCSNIQLIGHGVDSDVRIANNLTIAFLGTEAETVLLYLDAAGVLAGSGSACTMDNDEPSHVLKALGLSDDVCTSTIRFSLGRSTRLDQVKKMSDIITKVVKQARSIQKQGNEA